MILTSKSLAALVVTLLFGGIFFSSQMGWWQTESTKTAAVFTSGEFAGQANPADIRGSYTLGDVEKNFGVTADILVQAFGVQTDDSSAFSVKSLEEIYAESEQEIGTSSVRLFVAFYLGLPFDLSTDIYLPESAAAILSESSLTEEQAAYVDAHIIPEPDAEAQTSSIEPTPQPDPTLSTSPQPNTEGSESESTDFLVKGKTTFNELLEWGVLPEAIEQAMGMPLPASAGIKVKDFCAENGLSFETIKLVLQAEVDKVK